MKKNKIDKKEIELLRIVADRSNDLLWDLKIAWGNQYPASDVVWELDRAVENLKKHMEGK